MSMSELGPEVCLIVEPNKTVDLINDPTSPRLRGVKADNLIL